MLRIRRRLSVTLVVIVAALAMSSVSLAGNAISLSVWPQVQFVGSGQNALVNYNGVNNTTNTMNCSVWQGDFGIWYGSLAPGQAVAGQISTPALFKNTKLDFVFRCGAADFGYTDLGFANVKVR